MAKRKTTADPREEETREAEFQASRLHGCTQDLVSAVGGLAIALELLADGMTIRLTRFSEACKGATDHQAAQSATVRVTQADRFSGQLSRLRAIASESRTLYSELYETMEGKTA